MSQAGAGMFDSDSDEDHVNQLDRATVTNSQKKVEAHAPQQPPKPVAVGGLFGDSGEEDNETAVIDDSSCDELIFSSAYHPGIGGASLFVAAIQIMRSLLRGT